MCGVTEDFNVGVGVYQGTDLSPYLLSEVMDEVKKEIQGEVPWCMMFADDIEYGFGGRDHEDDGTKRVIIIGGDVIGEVESFKYLGSFVKKDGALA